MGLEIKISLRQKSTLSFGCAVERPLWFFLGLCRRLKEIGPSESLTRFNVNVGVMADLDGEGSEATVICLQHVHE